MSSLISSLFGEIFSRIIEPQNHQKTQPDQRAITMTSSPLSNPSFQALINAINLTNDNTDDASNSPAASPAIRATRLSYESSPFSNVQKAVDHATPPTGGESPCRQSRKVGDYASLITVPLEPSVDSCPRPSHPLPALDDLAPTSNTNPPVVSQTQTMESVSSPSLPSVPANSYGRVITSPAVVGPRTYSNTTKGKAKKKQTLYKRIGKLFSKMTFLPLHAQQHSIEKRWMSIQKHLRNLTSASLPKFVCGFKR